jgi:hypothetical protein
MRYLGTAAATALVAAAVLLLRGPARAAESPDTTAPTGAVAGVRDPASGTLQLLLYATDAGAGLASAEATLDGDSASFAQLAGSSVSGVPLPVNTHAFSDGAHKLVVEVTDAAGNSAKVLDRPLTVSNIRPPSGPTATLTLGVAGGGSGGEEGEGPSPGKGQGGNGQGGNGQRCRRPKLKMRLGRRPLWHTRPRYVPVLRYGGRYPFKGKLTCLAASGKRVPAARGTRVDVYYRVWHHSFKRRRGPVKFFHLRKTKVRKKGRLKVNLGFRSGRTVLFRYRDPAGEKAKAKLRLAVPPRTRRAPWGPR